MSQPSFKRTKFACYSVFFIGASAFSLPPVLFTVFLSLFQVSYTLLGTLVVVNFCTQMLIDLLFTAFSHKLNVKIFIKVMPIITAVGLFLYALIPTFFPQNAYVGLCIGTVIFSVSAGLSEVLLSPTIAAMPSENPQRDMSLLHSLYAFGFFAVVVTSTLFLKFVGIEYWAYLTMFFGVLCFLPALLFMGAPLPEMDNANDGDVEKRGGRYVGTVLCVACIFFGGCAETTMSNWVSSYMETALGIDKALGDVLGMATFAILLGLSRIAYAKFGKKIAPVLLIGMLGSAGCYLVAGLSTSVVFAFIACILTGMFTAMLWPGTLIMMEENMPGLGVGAYALMAAGGDLGASVAPQLMGVVVDEVSARPFAGELGTKLGLTAEQVGLKAGMLCSALFPILGAVVVLFAMRHFKKRDTASALKNE